MRIAAWRAEQDKLESGDKREQEEADKAKSFIDAKGKRKVAFIKKDVSKTHQTPDALREGVTDLLCSFTPSWMRATPMSCLVILTRTDPPTSRL